MSRRVSNHNVSGRNHHTRNVDWGRVRRTQNEELKKGVRNHGASLAGAVGGGALIGGIPGAAAGAAAYVSGKTIEHCVNTYIRQLD